MALIGAESRTGFRSVTEIGSRWYRAFRMIVEGHDYVPGGYGLRHRRFHLV